MSKKEEREYEEYENLKNSKFKQQKLPGWRPVPSMGRTVTIFFSLGVVFTGLGVLILLFSNKTVEMIERYDNVFPCNMGENCNITFNITEKMKKNVFVYYQLEGFFQNHVRYAKSRSEAQLKGEKVTKDEIIKSKDCDPIITNKEVNNNRSLDLKRDNELAYPCGLLAKNFFNDTFTFYYENNTEIKVDDTNIARKSDREKYKNNVYDPSIHWINMTDEHFLVWMRISPFSNFQKLWGRINEDLEGEIKVEINNNYPVKQFDGAKYIVLRTINNFGGKNMVLAITYIIFGGVSLILGIIFFIGFKASSKKEK